MDADTLSDRLLAPAGQGVRVSGIPDGPQLVPSPDGRQLALLSGSELSFVNVDGSRLRQAVLAYPPTGSGDVPFVPTGVWTEDSSLFLVNAPIESNDPAGVLNFTITQVAPDGSPPAPIATVISGNPVSVTFSPDGTMLAYGSVDPQRPGPTIAPLAEGLGPLAVPRRFHLDYVNLHWAPGGDAHLVQTGSLVGLCPGARQASQICGDPVPFGRIVESLEWLDPTRFVFASRAPETYATEGLFLGALDGSTRLIVSWSPADVFHSYDAVVIPHPG